MQTLQRASLNNTYLYQIQIILAVIQARAYHFMIRKSPEASTFLLGKTKDVVSLPIPYIGPSLSSDHQIVTIMNLKIYWF